MKRLEGNKVQTVCGRSIRINFMDQVALGVYDNGSENLKSAFIPDTFSLYQTGNHSYILETTSYQPEKNDLSTTYKLLSESEANYFLQNDRTRSVA